MLRRLLLCLALANLPAPAAAQAVYRCTDAEGRAVFTDQPCESIQAVPRAAPGDTAPLGATLGGQAALGCARTPEALRQGVRIALSAGDVNRLANYYHWPGTGTGAARYVMDTLEAIAARPLVGLDWWPPRAARAGAAATGANDPGHALEDLRGLEASAGNPATGKVGKAPDVASDIAARDGPAADAPWREIQGRDPAPTDPRPHPSPGPAAGLATPAGSPLHPGEASLPPRAALPALRAEHAGGPGDAGAYRTDFRLRRHAGCWWIEL